MHPTKTVVFDSTDVPNGFTVNISALFNALNSTIYGSATQNKQLSTINTVVDGNGDANQTVTFFSQPDVDALVRYFNLTAGTNYIPKSDVPVSDTVSITAESIVF